MHGTRPPPHPTSANFISSSSPNRAAGWGETSWLANPHPVASSSQGAMILGAVIPDGTRPFEIRNASNHIHTSARFCQQARPPTATACCASGMGRARSPWQPAWSGLAVALAPGRAASPKLSRLPGYAGDQSVGNTHQGKRLLHQPEPRPSRMPLFSFRVQAPTIC